MHTSLQISGSNPNYVLPFSRKFLLNIWGKSGVLSGKHGNSENWWHVDFFSSTFESPLIDPKIYTHDLRRAIRVWIYSWNWRIILKNEDATWLLRIKRKELTGKYKKKYNSKKMESMI